MSFRDVNIDIYDENAYVDPVQSIDISNVESLTTQKVADVKGLLSKGKAIDALVRSLEDPAYGPVDEELKKQNAKAVIDSLNSFKISEIPETLKELNYDQIDLLMKYIYRGLNHPEQFNCGSLLQWHEKIVETNGISSIVRVLTDKRTV
ncbi:ARP2/3 complex 16 kDa subunit (p16-Arc) [Conidiobolus coronatus NRRL 28638]|uniref:Actin-related protein 2/3 complex subunit 5 n=1 Tax=Conidiobolus coronatus (strain ATCC 28846 / CBS 209.66 / NRRL 28638) TaxID=796925 RepID=A0A137PCA3_CONC2|nr:ARP2/3 complex 16 kDa subunit (p16-Arc) [Conidiobolus coronatus NRRL 28638]|eukprot:KXN72605.1 ARP2/3 complex 16 kDa subunit (p16-Arc) [Conidiobolus coronatus NRRL 28638]